MIVSLIPSGDSPGGRPTGGPAQGPAGWADGDGMAPPPVTPAVPPPEDKIETLMVTVSYCPHTTAADVVLCSV